MNNSPENLSIDAIVEQAPKLDLSTDIKKFSEQVKEALKFLKGKHIYAVGLLSRRYSVKIRKFITPLLKAECDASSATLVAKDESKQPDLDELSKSFNKITTIRRAS